jgi:hypothetical protein
LSGLLPAAQAAFDFQIKLLVSNKTSYNVGETPQLWAQVENTGTEQPPAYDLKGVFTVVSPSGTVINAGYGWCSGGNDPPPGGVCLIANTDEAWQIPQGAEAGLYDIQAVVTSKSTGIFRSKTSSDYFTVASSPPPPPPSCDFSIQLLVSDKTSYNVGDTPSLYARVENTGSTEIAAYELQGDFDVVSPSGSTIAAGGGWWVNGGNPGSIGVIANTDNPWVIPSDAEPGLYDLKVTIISQHGVCPTRSSQSNDAFSAMAPPPPDFRVSLSPSLVTARLGQSVQFTVTVTSLNYWAGSVTLTHSLTTSGTSVSFGQNPVAVSENGQTSTTMTVSVSSSAWVGYSPFVVIGSSGTSKTHTSNSATLVTVPSTSSLVVDQLTTDKSNYLPGDQVSFSFKVTSSGGSYTFRPTVKVQNVGQWTQDLDHTVGAGQSKTIVLSVSYGLGWPSGTLSWGVTLEGPPPSYSVIYVNTGYIGTFVVTIPSYQLTLQTTTPDGANNALILLHSGEYTTPQSVSKPAGTYPISAYAIVKGFLFDHWEIQGSVTIGNDKSQTTTLQVSGSGTVVAVFVRVFLTAITSPFRASLKTGQSVSIDVRVSTKPATYQGSLVIKVAVVDPGDRAYFSSNLAFTGTRVTVTWPFEGGGVNSDHRPGTYSLTAYLYYSTQQTLGNAPITSYAVAFAFSVDTGSYFEVAGSSDHRVIHVHLAAGDVPQGKKVAEILYEFKTAEFVLGMVGSADKMLVASLGHYMVAVGNLAGYADYTANLAKYQADGSYDFCVVQTIGQSGKYYESRLVGLKDAALTNFVIQGLKLAAFGALLGTAAVLTGPLAPLTTAALLCTWASLTINIASYFVPLDYFFIPDAEVPAWGPIEPAGGSGAASSLGSEAWGLGPLAINTGFAHESGVLGGLSSLPTNALSPDGAAVTNAMLIAVSPSQVVRVRPGERFTLSIQYRISGSEVLGEGAQLLLVSSWGSGWPPIAGAYAILYDGVPSGQYDGVATFTMQAPGSAGVYNMWLVHTARMDVPSAAEAFRADLIFSNTEHIRIEVGCIEPGDFLIVRPPAYTWHVLKASGESWKQQWGSSGDRAFLGDVNGDGVRDIVVWRPSRGTWLVLKSGAGLAGPASMSVQWGISGDVPLVADFDGDGLVDLVIWRPSNGFWYVLKSTENYSPTRRLRVQWGVSGDVPLVGDFDGDGLSDFAIWRPGNGFWYALKSTTNYSPSQAFRLQWGTRGDKPLVGDMDGDGSADVIAWRPSNGVWYALKSTAAYDRASAFRTQWGTSSDTPLIGDFDGDGLVDLVIWRPSNGFWYVLKSTANYSPSQALRTRWGMSGDVPLVAN